MENPREEKAPKTIKAMSVRAWNRALAQSTKSGESMAEWLTRAIDQLADKEAGERESLWFDRGKPPARDDQVGPPVLPPAIPAGDMEGLVRAAVAAAQASSLPLPKSLARHAFAVVTARLRAARGLAPVKPRLPAGQTLRLIGQTKDAKHEFHPQPAADAGP